MGRPEIELHRAASRIVAHIVSGDDALAQEVINAGALPVMRELLKLPDRATRKECCWALSSIMAGTEEQLQAVVESQVFPQVVRLLAIEAATIQKEAAWCVINAVSGGTSPQLKYFVENGAIQGLCNLLVRTDLINPITTLDALDYVLKHGKHAGESYMALVDVFKVKSMGESASPEVRKRATRILDMVVSAAPFFADESNVFMPRGLLMDDTIAVPQTEGTMVTRDGVMFMTNDKLMQAWSKKWGAADELALELEEDKQRSLAAEALAETMYRDFFEGEDPFGVMTDVDHEEGPLEGLRGQHRSHKSGKAKVKRHPTSRVV